MNADVNRISNERVTITETKKNFNYFNLYCTSKTVKVDKLLIKITKDNNKCVYKIIMFSFRPLKMISKIQKPTHDSEEKTTIFSQNTML